MSAKVVIFNFGVSVDSAAFLALWSASSLPSMLLCPGTQISDILIHMLFD